MMDWFFFFQAEDGIRDDRVTGVQTCALPISRYLAAIRWKKGCLACLRHRLQAEQKNSFTEISTERRGNATSVRRQSGNRIPASDAFRIARHAGATPDGTRTGMPTNRQLDALLI